MTAVVIDDVSTVREVWDRLAATRLDPFDVVVVMDVSAAPSIMAVYEADPDCWMTVSEDGLSFRGFLWAQINGSDLQRSDGEWFGLPAVQVLVRPMLEMCGPTHHVIDGVTVHLLTAEFVADVAAKPSKPQMFLFDGGLCMHWRDRAAVILDYLTKYGIGTVVETGTADGATAEVVAASDLVRRWWTVEADPDRARITAERLRGNAKIYCLTGESPGLLRDLVTARQLDGQVLWWLDAHFDVEDVGGDLGRVTPIMDELEIVLARQTGDVVLVDDARLFGTYPGYPTLNEVRGLVAELGERHGVPYTIQVRHDIIRMVPE